MREWEHMMWPDGKPSPEEIEEEAIRKYFHGDRAAYERQRDEKIERFLAEEVAKKKHREEAGIKTKAEKAMKKVEKQKHKKAKRTEKANREFKAAEDKRRQILEPIKLSIGEAI